MANEMKYRDLKYPDLLEDGDEYKDPHVGEWLKTSRIGFMVTVDGKYRRPLKAEQSSFPVSGRTLNSSGVDDLREG